MWVTELIRDSPAKYLPLNKSSAACNPILRKGMWIQKLIESHDYGINQDASISIKTCITGTLISIHMFIQWGICGSAIYSNILYIHLDENMMSFTSVFDGHYYDIDTTTHLPTYTIYRSTSNVSFWNAETQNCSRLGIIFPQINNAFINSKLNCLYQAYRIGQICKLLTCFVYRIASEVRDYIVPVWWTPKWLPRETRSSTLDPGSIWSSALFGQRGASARNVWRVYCMLRTLQKSGRYVVRCFTPWLFAPICQFTCRN